MCKATATGVTVIVDFMNKIAIDDTVTSRMESLLALLAGRFLIECGDGERMLTTGRGFDVRIDTGGRGTNDRAGAGACMLTASILARGQCHAGRVVQVILSTSRRPMAQHVTMTVNRTKTTLPQAFMAFADETMSVLCLHEALTPLHSRLLMKLVEYVREDEEGHLRCRWGEGEYYYGGDVNCVETRPQGNQGSRDPCSGFHRAQVQV